MDVRTSIKTNWGNFSDKYGTAWEQLLTALSNDFTSSIEQILKPGTDAVDIPTIIVKKPIIIDFLRSTKDRYGYSFLSDMTAVDEEGDPRFFVVYHLMHLETKARVRIKTRVADGEKMPTAIPLWEGANWAEREIYDMFGIHFEGHPDLRRILMDQRWEGHPLRKDYPLRGYQIFLSPEPIDPELLS
ncbi:MAG: NADH-quinone oxidoreductase subunit C [Bdellovibrionales bacterium]|nr:NADH-quinone oxidoreductase subunit C [Bdellovibrionales bacterium]